MKVDEEWDRGYRVKISKIDNENDEVYFVFLEDVCGVYEIWAGTEMHESRIVFLNKSKRIIQ